jgi:hypothetical protein
MARLWLACWLTSRSGASRGVGTRSTGQGGGGGEEEISSGRLGARLAIVEERLSSLKGIEETLARIDRKLHTQ